MESKIRSVVVDLYRDLCRRLRHLQRSRLALNSEEALGYRTALHYFEQSIFGRKNGFDVEKGAVEADHLEALEEKKARRRLRRR